MKTQNPIKDPWLKPSQGRQKGKAKEVQKANNLQDPGPKTEGES
jgi:hypothetical protein